MSERGLGGSIGGPPSLEWAYEPSVAVRPFIVRAGPHAGIAGEGRRATPQSRSRARPLLLVSIGVDAVGSVLQLAPMGACERNRPRCTQASGTQGASSPVLGRLPFTVSPAGVSSAGGETSFTVCCGRRDIRASRHDRRAGGMKQAGGTMNELLTITDLSKRWRSSTATCRHRSRPPEPRPWSSAPARTRSRPADARDEPPPPAGREP